MRQRIQQGERKAPTACPDLCLQAGRCPNRR